ncbi:MAG TPA: Rrf2 family transcriptional regulator [Candidatus Acetothermia bacterium]|nr:Rrf2 family transcriptional regulator [Candidatus Acetothermia bacterium]
MITSRRLGYGVCVLYELATRKEGYHSARAIAGGYRVPEAFVRKILLDLRRAGLVTAQKGRSGGYRLAHPPQAIKLGQLLEALEPEAPTLVYGRQRGGGYAPGEDCPVRAFWKGIEETFTRALAESTLADVVDRSRAPSPKRAPKAKGTAPRGRKKTRK